MVDDNQELLTLLGRLVSGEGWEPLLVNRGKPAIEAIAGQRLDAAIVDVLLPDMMGYEVGACCKNAGVPFVFVTGVFKGPRAAQEAKAQHGAAGYFEKPFDAKALMAAIRALLPAAPAAATPAPAPAPADAPDDFDVEVAVDDEEAEAPADAEPAPTPPPEGALRDNLPDLLAAFYLAQQTGELTVQRGPVRKTVFFEQGLPRFAISNLRSDRLGPFLVRVGKLTEEQLGEAVAIVDATRRRMGEVLVELGHLDPDEKAYYVGQQVKAIIYTLFGWEEGAYRFHFTAARESEEIKLAIHPASLILRGVKRLYRRERLQRLLPDAERLAPSLAPVFPPGEVPLASWEKQLLTRVDGVRTVSELARESGKALDEARGSLYGMLAARILQRA
ncbi:hypothetical protein AMPC_29190 [Anaeromyxobacter paludicola]|uniref:Response regulatory domain-containing protein n=1 Tax=Anaeromyxobacter paludicola TaxID=2918171 RepID=A0ABN6N997_9BACT|nr:hypothetical protein AMPC_29190 [Anaeromyxobacter paludicola]